MVKAPTGIRVLAVAAASVMLLPLGAQRGGNSSPPQSGGAGQPGGNTGGRAPQPGNIGASPDTTGNQTNPTPGALSPPMYVSGQVMVDDGSEAPSGITIERVCGGSQHVEGHTDSKGYFNIQLGVASPDALGDAADSGFRGFGPQGGPFAEGVSQRSLVRCELRARLPGFVSQSVVLYDRQPLENPDIGTILLHRILPTDGTTVSATSLAAPKNARKALQKGLDLERKKKLDEAGASFQQAVGIDPKFAEAWFELGRLQAAQGQGEAARKSFDQSIAADSKYVPPYIQISLLEYAARRWQDLAETTEKAVHLDSFSYPQAFFLNAVANYNLHRIDAAEQSVRRAQKLDSQHALPGTFRLLGVILADRHDYDGAAAQMREYLKLAPQSKDSEAVRTQLNDLEKESGAAEPPQPQPGDGR